jgi:hypothetical protein
MRRFDLIGISTSIILTAPFILWVYPNLWDWMAMPLDTDAPGMRIFGLLFFGALVFAGSMFVFWIIHDMMKHYERDYD